MKLELGKAWFEKRIQPNEEFEVGAGTPIDKQEPTQLDSAPGDSAVDAAVEMETTTAKCKSDPR